MKTVFQNLTLLTLLLVMNMGSLCAKTFTYDFKASVPSVFSVFPEPTGFEATENGRGAQFTSDAQLYLADVWRCTKVKITYSTNATTDGNSMLVFVDGNLWGYKELTKVTNDTVVYYSVQPNDTTQNSLNISLTRATKSIYIKQIEIEADDAPIVEVENLLDPNYEYAEPTAIIPTGDLCNNQSYWFVQNNIEIQVSAGPQYEEYFGCNANGEISIHAAKPIKAVVIEGFLRKEFGASTSTGYAQYLDASEHDVTGTVMKVTDVDDYYLKIGCMKQLRIYNLYVYFNENPNVELEETYGNAVDVLKSNEQPRTTKVCVDGSIFIMRGGKRYNLFGYSTTSPL